MQCRPSRCLHRALSAELLVVFGEGEATSSATLVRAPLSQSRAPQRGFCTPEEAEADLRRLRERQASGYMASTSAPATSGSLGRSRGTTVPRWTGSTLPLDYGRENGVPFFPPSARPCPGFQKAHMTAPRYQRPLGKRLTALASSAAFQWRTLWWKQAPAGSALRQGPPLSKRRSPISTPSSRLWREGHQPPPLPPGERGWLPLLHTLCESVEEAGRPSHLPHSPRVSGWPLSATASEGQGEEEQVGREGAGEASCTTGKFPWPGRREEGGKESEEGRQGPLRVDFASEGEDVDSGKRGASATGEKEERSAARKELAEKAATLSEINDDETAHLYFNMAGVRYRSHLFAMHPELLVIRDRLRVALTQVSNSDLPAAQRAASAASFCDFCVAQVQLPGSGTERLALLTQSLGHISPRVPKQEDLWEDLREKLYDVSSLFLDSAKLLEEEFKQKAYPAALFAIGLQGIPVRKDQQPTKLAPALEMVAASATGHLQTSSYRDRLLCTVLASSIVVQLHFQNLHTPVLREYFQVAMQRIAGCAHQLNFSLLMNVTAALLHGIPEGRPGQTTEFLRQMVVCTDSPYISYQGQNRRTDPYRVPPGLRRLLCNAMNATLDQEQVELLSTIIQQIQRRGSFEGPTALIVMCAANHTTLRLPQWTIEALARDVLTDFPTHYYKLLTLPCAMLLRHGYDNPVISEFLLRCGEDLVKHVRDLDPPTLTFMLFCLTSVNFGHFPGESHAVALRLQAISEAYATRLLEITARPIEEAERAEKPEYAEKAGKVVSSASFESEMDEVLAAAPKVLTPSGDVCSPAQLLTDAAWAFGQLRSCPLGGLVSQRALQLFREDPLILSPWMTGKLANACVSSHTPLMPQDAKAMVDRLVLSGCQDVHAITNTAWGLAVQELLDETTFKQLLELLSPGDAGKLLSREHRQLFQADQLLRLSQGQSITTNHCAFFPAWLKEAVLGHILKELQGDSSSHKAPSQNHQAVICSLRLLRFQPEVEGQVGTLRVDCLLRRPAPHRDIAVEVDGPSHFMRDNPDKRTSSTVVRDKLLRAFGVDVVNVTSAEVYGVPQRDLLVSLRNKLAALGLVSSAPATAYLKLSRRTSRGRGNGADEEEEDEPMEEMLERRREEEPREGKRESTEREPEREGVLRHKEAEEEEKT